MKQKCPRTQNREDNTKNKKKNKIKQFPEGKIMNKYSFYN